MKTAIFAIALSATTAAQQPARDAVGAPMTGTSLLGGQVVEDPTNRPLRRATVTITGDNSLRRTTITDDEGKFIFRSLPAAHYSINASKGAYVGMSYGARRPGRPGIPVTLNAGQQLTNLQLKLPHGGAITGTIVDGNGRPQANVLVRAMERRIVNGERRLAPIGSPQSAGPTDDRGVYRIFGLPAGDYVIAATPPSTFMDMRMTSSADIQYAQQLLQRQAAPTTGANAAVPPPVRSQSVGYTNVFYPGTIDASSAATISISGDERTGIDFPLLLVPTASISGTVLGPDGRPASAQLTLMTQTINAGFSGTGKATDRNGNFMFTGIPPGVHRIVVRDAGGGRGAGDRFFTMGVGGAEPPPPPPMPPGGSSSRLWAIADVAVSGEDVSGLVITLQPGTAISGKLVFQGMTQAPTDLSRSNVTLLPAPGESVGIAMTSVSQTNVGANGQFRFDSVGPGKYRVNVNLIPAGSKWFLKSAIVNGADILDSSLEVKPGQDLPEVTLVFSDQATELSGKLVDAQGAPALAYSVIVFSTDKSTWLQSSRRTRTARPGGDGRYVITGLPPGDYFLAAVTDADPTDLYDTAFLDDVVAAGVLRIKIGEGEKKTQDLRLARIP